MTDKNVRPTVGISLPAGRLKTIPLSRLETDLAKTLNERAESSTTLVVEMPDQRLLAIQALDPYEDDDLMNELLESNPTFQALVAKSKNSSRKAFSFDDARPSNNR